MNGRKESRLRSLLLDKNSSGNKEPGSLLSFESTEFVMSDIYSASNRPGDGAPTTRSSGNSSLSHQISRKAEDPVGEAASLSRSGSAADELTSSASLLGRDASQKV